MRLVLRLPFYSNTKISLVVPVLNSYHALFFCHPLNFQKHRIKPLSWGLSILCVVLGLFAEMTDAPWSRGPRLQWTTHTGCSAKTQVPTLCYTLCVIYLSFSHTAWHHEIHSTTIKMSLKEAKWIAYVHRGHQVTESQLTIFTWEHSCTINKLHHCVSPREPRNIFRSKKRVNSSIS